MSEKNYFAKIIAKDEQGLQLISACCSEAKIRIKDIKFLKKNKVFLFFLERFKKEEDKNIEKINSICKLEFIEEVKSKNINQENGEVAIELLAIEPPKRTAIMRTKFTGWPIAWAASWFSPTARNTRPQRVLLRNQPAKKTLATDI